MHHRAGAGGNYDFADDTENGRIRLCIDAGPRQTYRAVSCFFRVIGAIAVPLARHGDASKAKQYPDVLLSIRPIVVPTGRLRDHGVN